MRHGPTNVAQDRTEWRASPRPTGPHAVTHPLPPRLIIYSHPHIPTQTPHTQKISPGASIPPCIYTLKGMESLVVTSYSSLSLDHSHFSCYLSHAPSPRQPLYPCLSRICNTHTYLSRPRQMHQLHIHTCYITYPIDLKSPLFTFISHTTFLLNKVWPKNYFRVSTIYNITKLYGGVQTLICIAWCPQWYLFRTVNLYIFILYTKLVIIKRNEEHLSLHRIPPCTPLSRMHTKLSPGPLKVSPQKIHACFIFLSRYMQWRSLYLKRKHDTYIGLQNPLITVTIYV